MKTIMDLINRGNKPTKAGFGEGIYEAGNLYPELMVLGADITASVGLDMFAKAFPERFFSLGIAEQNCAGVAAGLALSGKIPVFSTYGVFAALRSADQIRVSVCYNNLHVIIGGAHAGISVGPDGATHQALEDIAIMRVLPNMTLLSPCDATQAKLLTLKAAGELKGPVYIRFGREAVPDFIPETIETEIGKGQILKDGTDVSLIATGHMVWEALQAAYMLAKSGVEARVINIHTIKPIDKQIIIDAARETKCIVTIEEHQVYGGFGSAVAEVVVQHHPVRMKMIGINDTFGESGQPAELMKKFKLNAEDMCATVTQFLNDNH
ncbi:MAG TPA: transketolase C-terminal domain-containing protein [Bacteroidales bacterium]|nr:transketolase C-terminal domain-containing protein [Bacteroidales bacterium]